MADKDVLQALREAGVRRVVFGSITGATGFTMNLGGFCVQLGEVEFFPLSVFDAAKNLMGDEEDDETPEARRERDTEAPPAVNVPPAIARILQKGSVS